MFLQCIKFKFSVIQQFELQHALVDITEKTVPNFASVLLEKSVITYKVALMVRLYLFVCALYHQHSKIDKCRTNKI